MKPNELQQLLKNAKMVRVPVAEEKTTIELDERLVIIPRLEYADLIRKATLYSALKDDIRTEIDADNEYPVDNDVVMACVGMNRYRHEKKYEKAEAKRQAEENHKHIDALKEKLDEAIAERNAARAELEALKAGGEKPKEEPHE